MKYALNVKEKARDYLELTTDTQVYESEGV